MGVGIDKNLSWRPHIDFIALKTSKIVGTLARLRHHVPQIYRSLIFPYTLYGIPVWGQAAQRDFKKNLTLQKHALRLISFSNNRSHAIPSFIALNIFPVDMLFIHSSDVHAHNTRFSSAEKFCIPESRLCIKLKSFSAFGARL